MRILLTGGSACGKSTYGEALLARSKGPRYYLATMRPYGEESREKIARHQKMRLHSGFITIERETDVGGVTLPERGSLLLECMCNLLANEMFDDAGRVFDVRDKLLADVEALYRQCETFIVVTNDVGSDGGTFDRSTRAYIDALGQINCALAMRFDAVYELVCGIPLVRKGKLL